jgi:acyl-CoA thioesterase YciA
MRLRGLTAPGWSVPMDEVVDKPRGELTTRTLAMPADTNPSGDIFGGWVLAQMDIAGGIFAGQRAEGRVATIAVHSMKFIRPVYVGDVMCIYCELKREGRTSVAVSLEAWALRGRLGERVKVTEGLFTFVCCPRGHPAQRPADVRRAVAPDSKRRSPGEGPPGLVRDCRSSAQLPGRL